jgi:DNA helicase-2/ATP-dependent DNA helicase PcrA
MSDKRVAEALRSSARCVLVEAPAGFGKTFQGAQYAKDLLPYLFPGRLLILTHTNAACDVFAEQARGFASRVEIRTIDNFISRIATVYHSALGLPSEVTVWATQQGDDGMNYPAAELRGIKG